MSTPTTNPLDDEVNCEDLTPQVWNDINEFGVIEICWSITGALVLVATILSLYLVVQHFRNYNRKILQRQYVRIIMMVPVYGWCSWFSLLFYPQSTYIDVLRDVYESFILYCFVNMCLFFLGDDFQRQAERLQDKKPQRYPIPLNCFSFEPASRKFIWNIRLGIAQYVVIRLLNTVVAVVMEVTGTYCPESLQYNYGHVYVLGINLASVTLAMYVLVMLYQTIKDEVAQYQPVWKFVSVKFIVFLTFWQSLIISILSFFSVIHHIDYLSKVNVANSLNNGLVCIEMFIVAIMHVHAYNTKLFADEYGRTRVWDGLVDAFSPFDIVYELGFACYYFFMYIFGQSHRLVVKDRTGYYHEDRDLRRRRKELEQKKAMAAAASEVTTDNSHLLEMVAVDAGSSAAKLEAGGVDVVDVVEVVDVENAENS